LPAVGDPRALRSISLFNDLTDAQLQTVGERLRRHNFASGTNVVTFQTPGEVIYIILSGTVKIKVDQADGKEVIIAMLGPGEVFGELAVLDRDIRSADVMTQEDCVLLWMDRASFLDLLGTIPAVTQNLLRILTRRVRFSSEQIQALGTLDVLGKVARQLLVFGEQYGKPVEGGITIPMRLTQSDIAGIVGASRERVNQVFVSLRQRKLISVDGTYRISIHDMPKLRAIVEQR
jgi:CRP/FNR family transcriptional regulator, cyclic AMP receptor protein